VRIQQIYNKGGCCSDVEGSTMSLSNGQAPLYTEFIFVLVVDRWCMD